MELYEVGKLSAKQVDSLNANLNKENNPDIVETAGFEPLEVKFKRLEQNGLVARLSSDMFNSHDYREIYLNQPDLDIDPEDEIEDISEKLAARQELIKTVQAKKLAALKAQSNGQDVEAGTEEPEKQPKADKKTAQSAE